LSLGNFLLKERGAFSPGQAHRAQLIRAPMWLMPLFELACLSALSPQQIAYQTVLKAFSP
jgi:hypothetical protein